MTARTMLLSDEEINAVFNEHDRLFNPFAAAGVHRLIELRDRYEAERNRLLDRVAELEHYEKSYEEIVVRCRNTPGPCFCRVHITEIEHFDTPLPEKHEEKGRE